jgi:hypothetical protein
MELCTTRDVVSDSKHFGSGGCLPEDSETILRVIGADNSREN